MRGPGIFAVIEVTQQQRKVQIHRLRHPQPDAMTVARCHAGRFATAVLQRIKLALQVAVGRHDLHAVVQHELIFYRHFGPFAPAFAGKLAHKLLTIGDGKALLIVLVAVVSVTTQKAFGIATMCQTLQGEQQ